MRNVYAGLHGAMRGMGTSAIQCASTDNKVDIKMGSRANPILSEEVKALLDAANQASSQVAVLHIGFMAVCVYVLITVFGTTDMDLLIGKGVKLPVVDVDVAIVGFYASAPLLILLVHFNLLLQLQLLSRKLYAFDAAACRVDTEPAKSVFARPPLAKKGSSAARSAQTTSDLLHIFPYTYYLVGHSGPLVQWCLGIVIGITLLLMPLATMLLLQLRFLAYQSETITWMHRISIWIDIAMVFALWPIIMDREDSWSRYMRNLWIRLRRSMTKTLLFLGAWVAVLLTLLMLLNFHLWAAVFISAFVPLVLALLESLRKTSRSNLFGLKGMFPFVLMITLGIALPFTFVADGERLEKILEHMPAINTNTGHYTALPWRNLKFHGQILMAGPVTPELAAMIRSGRSKDLQQTLSKITPIDLSGRSLRGSQLSNVVLTKANLEKADLSRANLQDAHMEGANLTEAKLTDANLSRSYLGHAIFERANLEGAQLDFAGLDEAKLKSANLRGASFPGAKLRNSDLEKASLLGAFGQLADLSGANLENTDLYGADLSFAILIRTNLSGARMDRVDLRSANLTEAAVSMITSTILVDIRHAKWDNTAKDIIVALENITDPRKNSGNNNISSTLSFTSCLRNSETSPNLTCTNTFREISKFKTNLYHGLNIVGCVSTRIPLSISGLRNQLMELMFSRLNDMRTEPSARQDFLMTMDCSKEDSKKLARGLVTEFSDEWSPDI